MTEDGVLNEWGWRQYFADQLTETDDGLVRARVIRHDVNRYHLMTTNGVRFGSLRGRARLDAASRAELPVVGDWVLCSVADNQAEGTLVIERTLERFSKFSRKEAGDRIQQQVVAANIDTVFIVTGLDDNFSPGRIERYLLLTRNSGARPVIVLNKADLCDDLDVRLESLTAPAMGTPIHAISAVDGTGMEELRQYLEPGRTIALLGSSGVGKSTIINFLLGYERFRTGDVREIDSKGRHTTTFRELCDVPGGGVLMDTPGMREIQLWMDDNDLGAGFEDIDTLAMACRFADCAHESEPGCAVKAAIADGRLSSSRLETYHKFQREMADLTAKQAPGTVAQKPVESRKHAKSPRRQPGKRD